MKSAYRSYKSIFESLKNVMSITTLSDRAALKFGGRQKKEVLRRRFKLAVWNVYKGNGGDKFESEFRQILRKSDLVLAQEVLMHPQVAHLFNNKGYSWVHCASYKRRDGISDGVMSLCRSHGLYARRICSLATEPVFNTPKVSLITRYPVETGEELLVVNLHKILVRSASQSKKELSNILSKVSDHDGPAIVAGDFNTFTAKYQNDATQLLKRFGFSRVAPKSNKSRLMNPLDHIFLKGLKVRKASVGKEFSSSDHLPIFADLEFLSPSE